MNTRGILSAAFLALGLEASEANDIRLGYSVTNSNLEIRVPTEPGKTYCLQSTTNLSGAWNNASTNFFGNGLEWKTTVPISTNGSTFYQASELRPTIRKVSVSGIPSVKITVPTVSGHNYTIKANTNNLAADKWFTQSTFSGNGSNRSVTYPMTRGNTFYNIQSE